MESFLARSTKQGKGLNNGESSADQKVSGKKTCFNQGI